MPFPTVPQKVTLAFPLELLSQDLLKLDPARVENGYAYFRSTVVRVEEEEFTVQTPYWKRGIVFVPAGTEIKVRFLDKEQLYEFPAKVLELQSTNEILYRLQRPEEDKIRKIQRRQFVRVPVNLLSRLTLLDGSTRFTYFVTNLSAGGMFGKVEAHAFNLQPLRSGELLSGELDIENREEIKRIEFLGSITRLEPEAEGWRHFGLKFEHISEADREQLIRYCFERQLELKKKQL